MRYKAALMSNVKWRPLSEVYNNKGKYKPGRDYKGIPYSSAKEKDKFIGLDVSFYTFLSAVNNPKSKLYTERIDSLPYHGINCSSYYGTTCSSSVSYALGLGNQIPSADFKHSPLFYKIEGQTVESLEPGDVLASSGHSIPILDVQRESSSKAISLELFEIFKVYKATVDELIDYIGAIDTVYSIYRYKHIQRNQEIENLPFDYLVSGAAADYFANAALCPSQGDRSLYAEGDSVVMNILQDGYKTLELYRDGCFEREITLSGTSDVVIAGLGKGLYAAILKKESQESSEPCQFEIIDTNVGVSFLGDNSVMVSYNSSLGEPHSVVVCNIEGKQRLVYFLNKKDVRGGQVYLKYENKANEQLYCKVLFKGLFGKVSNRPIAL